MDVITKRLRSHSVSFRIKYDGKTPIQDIFRIQPAKLNPVISVEGESRNQVIYGDNLNVVCRLLSHDSFNRKVNLVYIDPPYSTGSSSKSRNRNHAYHDLMEGAEYLGFLRQRLILIRQLSAES